MSPTSPPARQKMVSSFSALLNCKLQCPSDMKNLEFLAVSRTKRHLAAGLRPDPHPLGEFIAFFLTGFPRS